MIVVDEAALTKLIVSVAAQAPRRANPVVSLRVGIVLCGLRYQELRPNILERFNFIYIARSSSKFLEINI
jgi:hypothetical protein